MKSIRKDIKKIYEKLSCVNCLVRPTCCVIYRDKQGIVSLWYNSNPCKKFWRWHVTRMNYLQNSGKIGSKKRQRINEIETEIMKETLN